MIESDTTQAIVLANGSGTIQAGFAGSDTPAIDTGNFYLHRLYSCMAIYGEPPNYHIGNKIRQQQNMYNSKYPINRGCVYDWGAVERIWTHIFTQLKVNVVEHPVLTNVSSLPTNVAKVVKEKLTQELFETYDAPAVYVANSAALSLHATGRTTGLVIESGYGATSAIPIGQGAELLPKPHSLLLGGVDITDFLIRKLVGKVDGNPYGRRHIFDGIKEKYCYIAENVEQVEPISYELPDGNKIEIRAERYECPEILFKPQLVDVEASGIHELAFNAVNECSPDIHSQLYSNIVLAGGSTLLPGMQDRLSHEMSKLASTDVTVIAPENRKHSCWFGGSIFAARLAKNNWILREDYEEVGPSIVLQKCISIQ
jgi:actin-related protein